MDIPAPLSRPTRRAVLAIAMSAGAAGVLAACGSGKTADPSASTSTPAGGEALTSIDDVPVGGGVILADAKVVVTQPTAGTFKAFSSTCTHNHCQLSGVSRGRITCPCHGSTFSITDGSPDGGPAPSPLPEIAVSVEGGSVVRS
jgi:nitrite reductase/ring-hydroxylating ferredoxin subunit